MLPVLSLESETENRKTLTRRSTLTRPGDQKIIVDMLVEAVDE